MYKIECEIVDPNYAPSLVALRFRIHLTSTKGQDVGNLVAEWCRLDEKYYLSTFLDAPIAVSMLGAVYPNLCREDIENVCYCVDFSDVLRYPYLYLNKSTHKYQTVHTWDRVICPATKNAIKQTVEAVGYKLHSLLHLMKELNESIGIEDIISEL